MRMRTNSKNIPSTIDTKIDPVFPGTPIHENTETPGTPLHENAEAPGTPIHETVEPTKPISPRKKVVPAKANNANKKKVSSRVKKCPT
jgi:hypothetical protein